MLISKLEDTGQGKGGAGGREWSELPEDLTAVREGPGSPQGKVVQAGQSLGWLFP